MAKANGPMTLWFRPVLRGNRKTCPNCKARLAAGEQIWSWGEYGNAKWRNVTDFCKECYDATVLARCFEVSPNRPKEITVKGGGKRPPWMVLEPNYHKDLKAMLARCAEEPYDSTNRLVVADACEELFQRPDLGTALRAQAQAFIWASRTEMCERSILVVSRDDFRFGRTPRHRGPFSYFNLFANLDAILLACGPPHAFGFEVVADLETCKGMAATPVLFCDNGGWYRDPEGAARPFQANYCYFVRPIPQDKWPTLMADLVKADYPRHEGDVADGREPVRVWKRWDYRFELYDLEEMKHPNHWRLGYRLYYHDNLVARSLDIGCPRIVAVDSDDALIGVMRWYQPHKDSVALEWEEDPHSDAFKRIVHELHRLFDASKPQAEFSRWCCPGGLVVGHQVLDCEACWSAFGHALNQQNQEMGAT